MSDEETTIPAEAKKPQDRNPKATQPAEPADGVYTFTVDGVTHELPQPSEGDLLRLPFEITESLTLNPDDYFAQMRYYLGVLNQIEGIDPARAALRGLSTKDALEILGGWLGE